MRRRRAAAAGAGRSRGTGGVESASELLELAWTPVPHHSVPGLGEPPPPTPGMNGPAAGSPGRGPGGPRATTPWQVPMSEHQRLVADLVVERLRAWGVERVYGHSGDGINTVLGAIRRAGDAPAFVQARHEENAALMAGGHAKYTGGGGGRGSPQGAGAGAPPKGPLR